MNTLFNLRAMGGVAFVSGCGAAVYALNRYTSLNEMTSILIVLGIVIMIPIAMLSSGKFFIRDKKLAFRGAAIMVAALLLLGFLSFVHFAICVNNSSYYCQ